MPTISEELRSIELKLLQLRNPTIAGFAGPTQKFTFLKENSDPEHLSDRKLCLYVSHELDCRSTAVPDYNETTISARCPECRKEASYNYNINNSSGSIRKIECIEAD